MQLKDLRGRHTVRIPLPDTFATAATVDTVALFAAPFNLTVEEVRFLPYAAITGNDTNNSTLAVQNRGAAGTGTTQIAAKEFATGEDAVAFVAEDITLSATAANRNVDEGSVIALAKTIDGTGLATEGVIEVDFINRGS